MLHAENILKGEAMISGPSCPLRLGVLDSPDYWTDDALMSAVRPLNPEELHHLAVGSQQRRNQQRGPRYNRYSIPAAEHSQELLKRRNQLVDPGA